jgi:hypothetical protein
MGKNGKKPPASHFSILQGGEETKKLHDSFEIYAYAFMKMARPYSYSHTMNSFQDFRHKFRKSRGDFGMKTASAVFIRGGM